jgi:hypothetical protein
VVHARRAHRGVPRRAPRGFRCRRFGSTFTGVANLFEPLLGWTLPIYTMFALRRVFKNGWLKTLLKTFSLALAYVLLAFVLWLAAFAYAALER